MSHLISVDIGNVVLNMVDIIRVEIWLKYPGEKKESINYTLLSFLSSISDSDQSQIWKHFTISPFYYHLFEPETFSLQSALKLLRIRKYDYPTGNMKLRHWAKVNSTYLSAMVPNTDIRASTSELKSSLYLSLLFPMFVGQT